MKAIMLVITERCNLRCRYCYETGDAAARMTFEQAESILRAEMADCADREVRIFFFGGEPFTEFPLIRAVYDYVKARYPQHVFSFAVTTNGTLVHGETQQWLRERAHEFHMTLSLDGTAAMHDRNRLHPSGRGSFQDIDLPFFAETWPGCPAKMTISAETFADFPDGIAFIERMGFLCKANFASGVDFDLAKNRSLLKQNLQRLTEHYTELPAQRLCYMLDLDLKSILVPLDGRFRYCDAGVSRYCYRAESPDWYPCQGLMPMAAGGEQFQREDFSGGSILKDSPCNICPFVRICKTCYAMNYLDTGCVWRPGSQTCFLNRACILTSARIQYNRLTQKQRLETEDCAVIQAVRTIALRLNDLFERDL